MSKADESSETRSRTWLVVLVAVFGIIGAGAYLGLRDTGTPAPEALEAVLLDSGTPKSSSEPVPDASQIETATAEPVETIEPAPESHAIGTDDAVEVEEQESEIAETRVLIPPSFDEIRQEADGLTVIAGRAEPGSTVTVLVDGVATATAVADGRGAFAAVGILDPGTGGRVLTLQQETGDVSTASSEEIILAPLPQAEPEDVQVAAVAEPTAADTMEPDTATLATPEQEASASSAPAQDVQAPDTPAQDVASETGPAQVVDTPDNAVQAADDTEQTDTMVALAEAPAPDVNTPPEVAVDVTRPTGQTDPVDAPVAPIAAQPPSQQRVAILRSTEGGVELLQAPPVSETVALDTIGYSDSGDVRLSGRAQAGSAEVRIYLDNDLVGQLPVSVDGRWRGELPQVTPGIYTLRIDEVDAAGKVTSRVETPFKREAPAVLADAAATEGGLVRAVTVQRGDTLWAIARDRYGEGPLYVRVFEANRSAIRDPDLIYPGQVFDLPD